MELQTASSVQPRAAAVDHDDLCTSRLRTGDNAARGATWPHTSYCAGGTMAMCIRILFSYLWLHTSRFVQGHCMEARRLRDGSVCCPEGAALSRAESRLACRVVYLLHGRQNSVPPHSN